MSAGAAPTPSAVCPLCQTAVTAPEARCPACGFDLAGVGGRPMLTQPVFWLTAMGLLVVYLVTLAIVVATK